MRGIEGKIEAIRFARTQQDPVLRHLPGHAVRGRRVCPDVLGLEDANSTEFDQDDRPSGDLADGRTRVGPRARGHDAAGLVALCADARAAWPRRPIGVDQINERHRHRYEFNNAYREQFQEQGLFATGHQPDGTIVEIIERRDHPWFLAVQFHPEFKSKPTKAHPLFRDFVAAAPARSEETEPD